MAYRLNALDSRSSKRVFRNARAGWMDKGSRNLNVLAGGC